MRLPLVLALLALPAAAQENPPNVSPEQGADGSVARLIEAHRLADLGLEMRDAVLVFAAARLMQGVTLREVTRTQASPIEVTVARGPKPDEKKKKKDKMADAAKPVVQPAAQTVALDAPVVVPDPAQSAPLPGALAVHDLMETARTLLPEGDLLRDVIANAETEVPPPGPVAEVTSLLQAPGGETTFALPLAGQSYAEIGLLRLGAGHLTLRVTDAAGNPVCRDTSAGPSALCGVVPRESDHFLITITNDGADQAPYLLITN